MRKLILSCGQALGDIVMLTAAVRDLHRYYPGQFVTDVRSHFPHLWLNNPNVTPLDETAPDVEVIHCHYPLIEHANWAPYHCLHGFVHFLNTELDLAIKVSEFRGDIHLTDHERSLPSRPSALAGEEIPYWIVSAGGKFDITIKWWSHPRFQEVVDRLRGRVQFVQIGDERHWHPKLEGAIDLRGSTTVRELVRLMHHAQGLLSPVTGVMHLAAAVETPEGAPRMRPAVVIGGGREPHHWEGYSHHQFLHTIGSLDCCSDGGCWKSRTREHHDSRDLDEPRHRCENLVGTLPRCMDMISVDEVVGKIEGFFKNALVPPLSASQGPACGRAVLLSATNNFDQLPLTPAKAPFALERALSDLAPPPDSQDRCGIVICASDRRYAANAWTCIRSLRGHGCTLPIELWLLQDNVDFARIESALAGDDVRCIAADHLDLDLRRADGPVLKTLALAHCGFEKALLLDADVVPLANPDFLFEQEDFVEAGAVFWQDLHRIEIDDVAMRQLGIEPRADTAAFDTGQVLVDRKRHWRAVSLAHWFDQNDDYFSDHFGGDYALQAAFWKTGSRYSLSPSAPEDTEQGLLQFDPDGTPLFDHRRDRKADYLAANPDQPHLTRYREEIATALRRTPKFGEGSERRIWHVYYDPEPRANSERSQFNFSRSLWNRQYRQARWQPLATRAGHLGRTRRDGARPAPYLLDVLGRALEHAAPNDLVVLTDPSVCPAPSFTETLEPLLDHIGCAYASPKKFPALGDALTDEQVAAGDDHVPCGMFAFSVDWWRLNGETIPDFALSGELWKRALSQLLLKLSRPQFCEMENAIYLQGAGHGGTASVCDTYNESLPSTGSPA